MTRGGSSAGARFVAPCLLAACLLLPTPVLPAEPARTLALVDFAVRAPAGTVAETAWLGPAVSELLQAKLQLFGGARVLERLRVGALLREAKIDAAGAGDDPASVSAVVPAEVLIAGSVSVDPKDPQRIRVQARAFETVSAKIIAETVFSGTTDLAGLLRIAEDLARTLADGLKLGYTAEQLAYAEPAGIDTLQSYVEGEEHLAAGRHREAITALQKALDGNQGRYYAAAHRLQGQAYQALVRSSTSEGERAVREEYLRKFKEDALAAAGAIFDLGLGYEANGMFKEAVETFEDYIKAIDRAGDTVRWRRWIDTAAVTLDPPERHAIPDLALEDGKLYVLAHAKLTILETETGQPILEGFSIKKADGGTWHIAGVEAGVLYLVWGDDRSSQTIYAAALGPDQEPLWERRIIDDEVKLSQVWMSKGLIHVSYEEIRNFNRSDYRHLLTLDRSGVERSRLTLTGYSSGDLRGFDPWSATLALEDGLHDLSSGRLLRTWETREQPVSPPSGGPRARSPQNVPKIERPTGLPGIVYTQEPDGLHLSRDGREILLLKGASLLGGLPSGVDVPHLLFNSPEGYVLLDPADGATATLYGDLEPRERPRLLAAGKDWLAFLVQFNSADGTPNPRYTLPSSPMRGNTSQVLNLVEVPGGRLLAKYQLPKLGMKVFFMGGVLYLASKDEISRISLSGREGITLVPAAEARLHIAEDLLATKDLTGALRNLVRFEAEYPRDPRNALVRMKFSTASGMQVEAARQALRALGSGFLSQAEVGPCLDAIRAVYPFVKDAIVTPWRGNLRLVSMAGPGIIVASGGTSNDLERVHLLIDASTKATTSVPTPDFPVRPWAVDDKAIYDGQVAYTSGGALGDRILRLDLMTGEKIVSDPFKTALHDHYVNFVPGLPSAMGVWGNAVKGRQTWELQTFDLDTLTLGARIADVSQKVAFVGNGRVVVADTDWFYPDDKRPVVVVDQETQEEVARFPLQLRNEQISSATADRDLLVVAVAGADIDAFRSGGRGTWFRVEAYPLSSNGARWTYEAAGFLGGNVIIEEHEVSFPAFEGTLGPEVVDEQRGRVRPLEPLSGKYPLRRINVERRSGRRRSDDPLRPPPGDCCLEGRRFWKTARVSSDLCDPIVVGSLLTPQGPRRIFPGNKQAIWGGTKWLHGIADYWFPDPDKPPVKSWVQRRKRDYRVYVEDDLYPLGLVWKDTVFESIGGGVILVKDLAKGEGLTVVHFTAWRR